MKHLNEESVVIERIENKALLQGGANRRQPLLQYGEPTRDGLSRRHLQVCNSLEIQATKQSHLPKLHLPAPLVALCYFAPDSSNRNKIRLSRA